MKLVKLVVAAQLLALVGVSPISTVAEPVTSSTELTASSQAPRAKKKTTRRAGTAQSKSLAGRYLLIQLNCSACAEIQLTIDKDNTATLTYLGEYGEKSFEGTFDGKVGTFDEGEVIECYTDDSDDLPQTIVIRMNGNRASVDLIDMSGYDLKGQAFTVKRK